MFGVQLTQNQPNFLIKLASQDLFQKNGCHELLSGFRVVKFQSSDKPKHKGQEHIQRH